MTSNANISGLIVGEINSVHVLYSIITTKTNLTVRIADYSNMFVLPPICVFGMLTSLGCLAGSFHQDEELNAKMLNYIFLNSLIDFVFLFIQFWLLLIRCGALCPYGYTYWAKFYEIYIYTFLSYVLATSQVILGIYVSIERLQMFSTSKLQAQVQQQHQRRSCQNKKASRGMVKKKPSLYGVYVGCVLVSTLLNAPPYLLPTEVAVLGIFVPEGTNSSSHQNEERLYIRKTRPEFKTSLMQALLTLVLAFKDPFLMCVFCLFNGLVCIRLRQYLNNRKKYLTSKATTSMAATEQSSNHTGVTLSMEKRESKFTLLTLVHCAIFLTGHFIDCFSMMATVFLFDIYVQYWFITIGGNILYFVSHGVNLFVYYHFNHTFRKQLNACFKFTRPN